MMQDRSRMLASAGLGLAYSDLRLERTQTSWVTAGEELAASVARVLGASVARVERVGSTAVAGLLGKPIVDLAVGIKPESGVTQIQAKLEEAGWIYRGDAGKDGGHVFVLESRPWFRVAHLHAVEFGGEQWINYLHLRDVLRTSAEARRRYETEKLRLVAEHPTDRRAYTTGKTVIITELLTLSG